MRDFNEAMGNLASEIDRLNKENIHLTEQLAKANERVKELESYNVALANESHKYQQRCAELEQDKARLDLLDKCNAKFNKACGSNYGWKVDWNHNRIALVDTGIPKTDVRSAIDEFSGRLQLRKGRE